MPEQEQNPFGVEEYTIMPAPGVRRRPYILLTPEETKSFGRNPRALQGIGGMWRKFVADPWNTYVSKPFEDALAFIGYGARAGRAPESGVEPPPAPGAGAEAGYLSPGDDGYRLKSFYEWAEKRADALAGKRGKRVVTLGSREMLERFGNEYGWDSRDGTIYRAESRNGVIRGRQGTQPAACVTLHELAGSEEPDHKNNEDRVNRKAQAMFENLYRYWLSRN